MGKAPRLSLLSLLLVVGAVAAIFAAYASERRRQSEAAVAANQNASLRAEIEALRIEQGQLIVDDPSKAYLVEVPTDEEWIDGDTNRWRYRVYLPELPTNAGYMMQVCEGPLPTSGYPGWDGWQADQPDDADRLKQSGHSIAAGQDLIDFALVRDDESWSLRYHLPNDGWGGIRLREAEWASVPNGYANLAPAKARSQKAFDPLGPIPVMRLAERTGDLNDSFDDVRRGVLVYLEPMASSPTSVSGPAAAKLIKEHLRQSGEASLRERE